MISMWKMREMVDKATNLVMNYTETEAKVREATNDDPWGPSGVQMQEIASYTFTYEQFPEVMGMLWKRMLQDNRTNWRRTYKSLLLLDYLIKNGSERVVTNAREHVYDLRSMENYAFVDENGKDQGINIRHKVTDMIDFVQDDDRLRDERKKAKKNKDKYVGMSSESTSGFRSKGFGGFDSGSGGGGGWKDDWNSHRSNSNPSGFRDHSDDDGSRGPSPDQSDVKEFRDEDRDYSPVTESKASKFSDSVTATPTLSSMSSSARPSTAPTSSNTSKTRASKPIKKTIDLGAAANLAAAASSKSPTVQKPASQIDLFGINESESVSNVVKQQPTSQSAVDLFGGNDDEDDFNPRQNSGSDSANANGDFGNFESAFGETKSTNSNNITGKTDSFADFSSAFGGSSGGGSGQVSGSLPAPPTPPPGSNFDLMAPTPMASAGAAPVSSNFDLLGGLVMSSSAQQQPPPLVGFPTSQQTGSTFPPSPMNQAPMSMPMDLFSNPMMGSGGAQPISLMTMNNTSNNNHNVTSSANSAMTASSAMTANKKSTMWDNVGNVNIDLDNLSLKGGNDKKSGMPMNSLITPTASPQRTQHGSALGMAPPPLKPVQGSQSSNAGGSLDLGDLLN